jgi:hypothetical protein
LYKEYLQDILLGSGDLVCIQQADGLGGDLVKIPLARNAPLVSYHIRSIRAFDIFRSAKSLY